MKSTPSRRDHTAANPKVLPCTCKHEYQDKKYGSGNRLHNPIKGDKPTFRCTVCGRPKD